MSKLRTSMVVLLVTAFALVAILETTHASAQNVLLDEDFDSYSSGGFPSGWDSIFSGEGWQYQVVTDSLSVSTPNSFTMLGRPGWSAVIGYQLETPPQQITFSGRVRVAAGAGTSQTAAISLANMDEYVWGMYYCQLRFGDTAIWLASSGEPTVYIQNYDREQWYHWKVQYDDASRTAAVWIDNVLINPSVALKQGGLGYTGFTLASDWPSSLQCWYDDIYITTPAPPQSYRVALDIMPGACPNPFNVKNGDSHDGGNGMATGGGHNPATYTGRHGKKAVLPVAILGAAGFNVAQIDATTVVLEGVPAVRFNYEDVATPVGEDADECECNDYGPDGFVDMTLKFYKALIIAALGEVADGDIIPLTISGQLIDGTPFEGTDCIVIVGGGSSAIADDSEAGEAAMASVNNYPNPFNPVTTISFNLPQQSDVKVEIYNIKGQRVTTLVDGQFNAGEHSCTWDGSAVASGVYFYRLETPRFTESKKMVLLK